MAGLLYLQFRFILRIWTATNVITEGVKVVHWWYSAVWNMNIATIIVRFPKIVALFFARFLKYAMCIILVIIVPGVVWFAFITQEDTSHHDISNRLPSEQIQNLSVSSKPMERNKSDCYLQLIRQEGTTINGTVGRHQYHYRDSYDHSNYHFTLWKCLVFVWQLWLQPIYHMYGRITK